eukprot:688154-Pyramimonas_sp.AAC.1
MQKQEQARDTPSPKRQRLRKMQRAIQKRGRLWAPTGKIFKINAVEVLHDHSHVGSPSAMIAELRRQWTT